MESLALPCFSMSESVVHVHMVETGHRNSSHVPMSQSTGRGKERSNLFFKGDLYMLYT